MAINAPITTRTANGTELTWQQMDGNLISLQTGIASAGTQIDAFKAPTGAALIGIGGGRTQADKNAEIVSVKDFGAKGDGVTDDTDAVLAAAQWLGSAGGTVCIPAGAKVLIDSNMTLPSNVTIKGPYSFVGSPATNVSAPYGSLSALIINPSATITLSGGAGISGCLVYRKGMTFPAADSSQFAGVAFAAGGDDAYLERSMILGFSKAVLSNGYQRGVYKDLKIDCINGIEIAACYDIPVIESVECWPFATIAALGPATSLQRMGTAFYLHDVADWAKLSNCFSYGYKYGFDINSVNTPTLVSCSADGTAGANIISGSRGFSVRGTSNDAKLIGCQAASQEISFYHDTTANTVDYFVDCIAWSGSIHGFFFGAGDASVIGGGAYNVPNGVTYSNASSRVLLDGVYFGKNNSLPINPTISATTDKLLIKNPIFANTAAGSSPFSGMGGSFSASSIASAGQLNIPATGDEFNITGTNGIGNIHEGWAGRQITLFFSSALTVINGTGSANAVRLSGGTNFVVTAGSTLTLRHNGTQWFEVGRCS